MATKKRKKNPSRADRCADACAAIDEAVGKLESAKDGIADILNAHSSDPSASPEPDNDKLPDSVKPSDTDDGRPLDEFISSIEQASETAESGVDTLDELKEEIENWRDNMPENLQGSEKYEALDQCASGLESAVDSGRSDDIGDIVSKLQEAETYADLREVAETLDEAIDNLVTCKDEAEGVEFPGMMG